MTQVCRYCEDPLSWWARVLRFTACKDCVYRMSHGESPVTPEGRRRTLAALRQATRRPWSGLSGQEAELMRAHPFDRPAPEFSALQAAARGLGLRYYGSEGTIHQSGEVNVEVFNGEPVAVWFRCQMVPFDFTPVDEKRANEMLDMAISPRDPRLVGLVLKDVDG